MQKYVLGFAFDWYLNHVVLIQKLKPAWQAGRYNGVGGKVEPLETNTDAMIREFREETGISATVWEHFGELEGSEWVVQLYTTTIPSVFEASSTTEEKVLVAHVDDVVMGNLSNKCLSNIPWLVMVARNILKPDQGSPEKIHVRYK